VVAVHGVTVAADLPGIVGHIAFESGRMVREGDLLVQLDTKQEQAQLTAAQAQLELARINLDRMEGLKEKGIAAQADLDKAEAEFKQAEAKTGEIRATIARTTIYVRFSVPQQETGRVRVGGDVAVTSQGSGIRAEGKITAIDSVIDPATRNVQVQATLPNADGKLKPGMFVETGMVLGTPESLVALPATAINHAPYGDSVFIVTEMKDPKGKTYKGVRQQFVKVGTGRGDQVAVLSGVEPGEEVVTSGVFKLRNGAAVQVNNETQPSNNPAPKPEDS
jgi:membrane fusion protein (multidrug efflux system)